jgi:hypothetical protein
LSTTRPGDVGGDGGGGGGGGGGVGVSGVGVGGGGFGEPVPDESLSRSFKSARREHGVKTLSKEGSYARCDAMHFLISTIGFEKVSVELKTTKPSGKNTPATRLEN